MANLKLKKMPRSRVQLIRLRNRKGFAAICLNNLTEGATAALAINRLKHPLKRMGFELS